MAVTKLALLRKPRAYYIDYRNARPKYVEAFWKVANWDFAAKNLKDCSRCKTDVCSHRREGAARVSPVE
jgi:hypothetical protein